MIFATHKKLAIGPAELAPIFAEGNFENSPPRFVNDDRSGEGMGDEEALR